MNSGKLLLGWFLTLLLLAVPAWAQTARYSVPAASVEDTFSAYRAMLSGAADSLLATTAKREPESQPLSAPGNTRRSDDRAVLDFAGRY